MDFTAMFTGFTTDVLSTILTVLVTAILPVVMAAIFQWLKKNGLEIEARHREALQSALKNAALVAIERYVGKTPATISATYKEKAVEVIPDVAAGIEYVRQSVPDAIGQFKLDTGRIKDLLEPHIAEAAKRIGVTTKSN